MRAILTIMTSFRSKRMHRFKDDDWNSEVDSIEKIITHCSEEELKTAVLNMLEHLHEAHYNLNEYQIVILEISSSPVFIKISDYLW